MIEKDNTGKYLLTFTTNATIRRLPIPRYGTAKSGKEWSMGSVLVEAYEEDESASAQLYLITWDSLMIEQLERLGVGKKVVIQFHIECSAYYDNYRTNLVLDSIEGKTENENFLYGITKKGE